jgi:N-methylhydantoinase B
MNERPDGDFGDVDPITVEVIRGYLQSLLQNMISRLIASALSPNITERQDVSSAIIGPDGRTIVQLEVAPIHLAELAGAGQSLLDNYPVDDIHPGDVFIVNDCYSGGGTHLPDVTIMMPVFVDDELVGIVANLAHHVDIGGTGGAGAATIYDEGLRIPVTKLVDRGSLREDVLRFILLNCRLPDQRRGDLVAQIAANELAAQDLVQLCERHGVETVLGTYGALQEYAKRKLRARIREMPEGRFEWVDYMDDDGSGETMIPIQVALTVAGGELHVDFTGTGPQTDGNINLVAHGTEGCVLYALRAALDPTIPPTSAFLDCVQLTLPPLSIVNPSPPAGCRARVDTAQRVVGVLLGALAQAMPDRLPAGGCDSLQACSLSGDTADGTFYAMVETFGGGSGARPTKDGLDATQVHMANVANFPLEVAESEYPMRYRRHVLRTDSGGAGLFRGGLGEIREWELLAPRSKIGLHGDRHLVAPWGTAGGHDGVTAECWVNRDTDEARKIPSKVIAHAIRAGDVFTVMTPGAGGYGDPFERDPAIVLEDVLNERVSVEAARERYGVVLGQEDGRFVVDADATREVRESRNATPEPTADAR